MQKAGDDFAPQVGRGERGDPRQPETAETHVGRLITQRRPYLGASQDGIAYDLEVQFGKGVPVSPGSSPGVSLRPTSGSKSQTAGECGGPATSLSRFDG
jgi:hypothetical protein